MELAERAAELTRSRVPFVQATVVRAGKPASAHAGDTALVLTDGAIEGFVGGDCAENSVRVHALAVLGTGDALLLRIEPGVAVTRVEEGAVTVVNPCLSGGSLEIFLEPRLPSPRLVVVGNTPIAAAIGALGAPLGFRVETEADVTGADAVVVASQGRDEEPALEAALYAGVPYVGLVASKRRGGAVLAGLEVTDEQRARVHSPAGLDLGGQTAPEVALSILAEIVALRASTARPSPGTAPNADRDAPHGDAATRAGPTPAGSEAGKATPMPATDPICGMAVAISSTALRTPGPDGETVYFCGEGCRRRYLADQLEPTHADGMGTG